MIINITEILQTGCTMTGRQLAEYFNTDKRTIEAAVQRERRAGSPICAHAEGGYYLAQDPETLKQYSDSLKRRADEMQKTRRLIMKALAKMQTACA